MWLYVKLAWRNIFRNKRRTIIAGIAIGIGLASMIFTDALIVGMERNMIRSATASFMGEGQIHRQGFRTTYEVDQTIAGLDKVVSTLETDSLVRHFSVRVMSLAMISSPANLSAVSLVGINPETEMYLSQIDEAIVEGDYFAGDDEHNVVIGTKLAELLEVGLGDRIVITAAQAHTGNLAQEMFRVSGLYFFNVEEMDKGMAFVRIDRARQMLDLEGQAHEIAVAFVDPSIGRDTDHPIWKKYSQNGNEALSWTQLMPQFETALKLSQFSSYIVGIILFSVVALGIINTLFMSLHERMFEFGVLRAVGTRPLALGRLILFEAAALAVVSIILGSLLGMIVTLVCSYTGIDYTGIEFAGVTFRDMLYPVLVAEQFIIFPALVFVFTIVIACYPAVFAARLKPVDAMRRSF